MNNMTELTLIFFIKYEELASLSNGKKRSLFIFMKIDNYMILQQKFDTCDFTFSPFDTNGRNRRTKHLHRVSNLKQ